jgi:hypothetical protein
VCEITEEEEEEEKGTSKSEFKFKHDLLLLWVPEEEHSLWNSQSPLKTKEMAFLKNANIASTSLRGIRVQQLYLVLRAINCLYHQIHCQHASFPEKYSETVRSLTRCTTSVIGNILFKAILPYRRPLFLKNMTRTYLVTL